MLDATFATEHGIMSVRIIDSGRGLPRVYSGFDIATWGTGKFWHRPEYANHSYIQKLVKIDPHETSTVSANSSNPIHDWLKTLPKPFGEYLSNAIKYDAAVDNHFAMALGNLPPVPSAKKNGSKMAEVAEIRAGVMSREQLAEQQRQAVYAADEMYGVF